MTSTRSFTSLADWLPWLETLSPREIVLGLDRVQTVLERLDLQRPPVVIHVGGTNGKGSCVSMLDALIRASGRCVGAYTSPHIHRYNERIRIDGEPATDVAVLDALHLVESVRDEVPLTFFEFGTLAALAAFNAADVDVWVLEVGLGGRLDAVNAIDPDVSLITNVALDHCAWLGNDVESIGREKAGIMRPDRPLIYGSEIVPSTIREVAVEVGAELRILGEHYSFGLSSSRKKTWNWQGVDATLNDVTVPALIGDIQVQNAAAVLATIEALDMYELLDVNLANPALSAVQLEGRFQTVNKKCLWVLDVAHNPAAATAFANRFRSMEHSGSVIAVIGMLQDKDLTGFLTPFAEIVDRWVAVTVDGLRATAAIEIARQVSEHLRKPCQVIDDVELALDAVDQTVSEDDVVIVAGSFYIVGPALEWLRRN